jgi:hypothetical protein
MSDGLTKIPEREAPPRIRDLRAHLVLHAPPGRVDAREQRTSLRGRAQLVMPVPRSATDVHQAPAHQRPDVAQEGRPVHPQALREWRKTDAVARRRSRQDRELRGAETERAEGRVVPLRDDPRRPSEGQAQAVLEILQFGAGRGLAGRHKCEYTHYETSGSMSRFTVVSSAPKREVRLLNADNPMASTRFSTPAVRGGSVAFSMFDFKSLRDNLPQSVVVSARVVGILCTCLAVAEVNDIPLGAIIRAVREPTRTRGR